MKKILAVTLLSVTALGLGFQSVEAAGDTKDGVKTDASIKFVPKTGTTNPVDPTNPDPNKPVKPVDPETGEELPEGTNGPLSIDFASVLSFGSQEITNEDMVYHPKAQKFVDDELGVKPNYVQISDHRGTNKGWTLSVTQETEFKTTANTENTELKGATLSFKKGQAKSAITGATTPTTHEVTLVPTAKSVVMEATDGVGMGTWVNSFAAADDIVEVTEGEETYSIDKGISLAVPGAIAKDAVEYKTVLIWNLEDTVANKN